MLCWPDNQAQLQSEYGSTTVIQRRESGMVIWICSALKNAKPGQLLTLASVQAMWSAFMAEVEAEAKRNPYVIKPSAGQCGQWLLCGLLGE